MVDALDLLKHGLGQLLLHRVELPVGQLLAARPHIQRQQPAREDVLVDLLARLVRQLGVLGDRQVVRLVEDFAAAAGGIDVLVNNAGTLIERQDIEAATLEYHEDVYATNVRSVFLASQAAIGYLKESRGNIVNIGSVAGHNGGGGGSVIYAAAKAAVATLTIAMAKEFGKYRVRVNSILPGLIETRFHEQFSTVERKKAVAKQTPMGRNGRAEDVAKAILFLASDEAAGFIDGEYIAVNGGLYMRA